jgi:hypothetical protein
LFQREGGRNRVRRPFFLIRAQRTRTACALFIEKTREKTMDLRSYYKKVREAEAALKGNESVLVSLATAEGGKDGVRTEAPRAVAARLIAEGRARAATEAEAAEFREGLRAAREKYEQDETARRVQIVMVPAKEARKTKIGDEQ